MGQVVNISKVNLSDFGANKLLIRNTIRLKEFMLNKNKEVIHFSNNLQTLPSIKQIKQEKISSWFGKCDYADGSLC